VRRSRRTSEKVVAGARDVHSTRFVRLIEFQTTRVDEVRALERQWRDATEGTGTATAMSITKDRDRHNRYVWMVEFPSYEHAARSDELEETRYIAEQLMKLADGPAVFRNLDVLDRLL
jgi:hypothetical protein